MSNPAGARLDGDELLSIGFDQFGRYRTIASLVELNRTAPSMRILDIGGHGGHLRSFLPDDEITVLDVVDEVAPGYVRGDALDLPFEDGDFDVVASADVLEHVPRSGRPTFLDEGWRVARSLLIVAAPFDTPGVAVAEERADAVYRALAGRSYRWLAEHREHGLPGLGEVRGWAASRGLAWIELADNPLAEWSVMLAHYFFLDNLRTPAGERNYAEVNRRYNALQRCSLPDDTSYRRYFALARTPPSSPPAGPPTPNGEATSLEHIARTVSCYRDAMTAIDAERRRLAHDLDALRAAHASLVDEHAAVTGSRAWRLASTLRHHVRRVSRASRG